MMVPRLSRGCHVMSSTLLRISRGNVCARRREIRFHASITTEIFHKDKQQTDSRTNGRGEREIEKQRQKLRGRSLAVDCRRLARFRDLSDTGRHPLLPSVPPLRRITRTPAVILRRMLIRILLGVATARTKREQISRKSGFIFRAPRGCSFLDQGAPNYLKTLNGFL